MFFTAPGYSAGIRTCWPEYFGSKKSIHGHIDVSRFGLAPISYINNAAAGAVAALDRSVISSTPLLSVDSAGPAWLSSSNVKDKLSMFRVVFEEIDWLPKPSTFREAWDMYNDDRMVSLRNYIEVLFDKCASGELSQISDVRNDIKKTVSRYKNKTWAANTCRVVTYVTVPISVAEVLMGGAALGLGLGFAGATSQLISDLFDRNRKKHWLSIGNDFI